MNSRIMCATQPVCNAHILLSLHLHCTFSAAPPAAQLTVPEVLALARTTAKGGWVGGWGGGEAGGGFWRFDHEVETLELHTA